MEIVEGANEVKRKLVFEKLKMLYDRYYGKLERRKVEMK
jgi:hypothetical protein